MEQAVALFGSFDENIHLIEKEYGVAIVYRGDEMKVSGEAEGVEKAVRAIETLLSLVNRGGIERAERPLLHLPRERGHREQDRGACGRLHLHHLEGKPVKAKTLGQRRYRQAIQEHTITLGVGPAGTGKTYLAVALAVTAFRRRRSTGSS